MSNLTFKNLFWSLNSWSLDTMLTFNFKGGKSVTLMAYEALDTYGTRVVSTFNDDVLYIN